MTSEQRLAIRPYREALKHSFSDALLRAGEPGQARIWFVPFLAKALGTFYELRQRRIDGRRLSKALAKLPRDAFLSLLKATNRDAKTRSRWAATLDAAFRLGVTPSDLSKWLRQGGGVAGRARKKPKPVSP